MRHTFDENWFNANINRESWSIVLPTIVIRSFCHVRTNPKLILISKKSRSDSVPNLLGLQNDICREAYKVTFANWHNS